MKRKNIFLKAAALILSLACLTGCASNNQSANLSSSPEGTTVEPTSASAAESKTAETSVTAAGTTAASAGENASAGKAVSSDQADWTLMLYLCGSTLEDSPEHCASTLIDRLAGVEASDKVNFLIETGGSKVWKNEKVSPDKIQRFQISGSDLELRDEQPLASMADPDTLTGFLKWGTEKYPAKHTIAILMDHGGGISGAEQDEIFDYSLMSMPEIAQAFKNSGAHFDIIGFDACLMANYENAAMLSPYADYLLASQETEQLGWDYTQFGQTMVDNPEITPEILGRNICDGYVALRVNSNSGNGSTLSLTDLSKIQPVVDAVSEMGKAMSSCIPDTKKFVALTSELASVKRYYYSTSRDLVDFARKAEVLDKGITQKVVSAVQNAVVYKVNADAFTKSNGLNIFYGLNEKKESYDEYAAICPSPDYLAFLDAVNYGWRAPESLYQKTKKVAEPDYATYHVNYELVPNGDQIEALHVTQGLDSIINIDYRLYQMDKQENRYYLMGTFPNLNPGEDESTFTPYFDGEVVTVGGVPCSLSLVEEQSSYSLYETPVKVEYEIDEEGHTASQPGNLRLLWTPNEAGQEAENGTEAAEAATASPADSTESRWAGARTNLRDGYFEILGIRINGNTEGGLEDIPSRMLVPMDDGLKITFEIPETDAEGYKALNRDSGSIIYSRSDTKAELKKIDNGDYAVTYVITDALGHTYYSDMLGLKIKDGVMKAEEKTN